MPLTKGDDYPIHQTPEPVAFSGTDRNFYDRYFFNGYPAQGKGFFAAAFGVYPHLNICDAAFCIIRGDKQINLHASRWLNMERMDISCGPIRIDIVEPLNKLKITVDDPQNGIKAEIVFTGRAFPIEEPRFIRRIGPRSMMDYTRLTQNGRYSGWIEVDGEREDFEGWLGTRDRSWGVRPIGARDPQPTVPTAPPQFFWLWSPTNFEQGAFFFHTNDDGDGHAWNRRLVWCPEGSNESDFGHVDDPKVSVNWKSGTRHAVDATVTWTDGRGESSVKYEPEFTFFMLGLGYGHPVWSHGLEHGPLKVEREDFDLTKMDVTQPHHLHIQAVSKATYTAGGETHVGRGVLEQLVMGPHAPSGFKDILDMAK